MKPKKKFRDTTVGKILGTTLGLINPNLGNLVQGTGTVQELIEAIKTADATPEEKANAQEIALRYYEAEVHDRIAARQREAAVATAGGSDILFKTIGWSIAIAFLAVVSAALGFIEVPTDSQRMFDMAFGAVVAKMTAVVSYYFGSSIGSKQKTNYLSNEKTIS